MAADVTPTQLHKISDRPKEILGRGEEPQIPIEPFNGAAPVRVGQSGEAAVKAVYPIGEKGTFKTPDGRTRIADGLTPDTVSEVKNVKYQGLTRQIKDYITFAQSTNPPRTFYLYVKRGATLSGPLLEQEAEGNVIIRAIP